MFAEIDDRREQVQKAHQETFRWIFEDGNETGFAEWLSSGDGIFWVQGKPASGKSTLMKFITREGRLHELLNIWADGNPLVVASFYFWVTGSQLQRSIDGLYRTLLHQMLKADEQMCRVAFPDWQEKFIGTEPTIEMLAVAMKNVLTAGMLRKSFCFIVDGLDEYDGDSIRKTQLAKLMLNLTKTSRVKLLISSRPESPFRSVFQPCPTLRLEQLTARDMEVYVEKTLWSDPSVSSISDAQEHSIKDIASFIIGNAQGVFLWVMLTINIALDGISNYEDVSAVRDRVMLLPTELDQLFTHILRQRIPSEHRQEAFRCLYIAFVWQSKALLQLEPKVLPSVLVSVARRAFTYEEACSLADCTCSESLQYFSNRLANRCQGLLEVGGEDNDVVLFLHRTLLDYLNEEEEAHLVLKAELGDKFDVHTAIMAGIICAYREYTGFLQMENSLALKFFYLNKLAERTTGQPRSELIARFGRLKSTVHVERAGKPRRHWSAIPLDWESSMPAWAAYCGASRYIEGAIKNGQISGTHELSLLLYWALKPIFIPLDRPPDWPAEPNIEISALLLNHGADPVYEIEDVSPWSIVLEWLVNNIPGTLPSTQSIFDKMLRALHFLLQFARRASDLNKCSAIEVFDHLERRRYTASSALRERLTEGSCCQDLSVETCGCPKARALIGKAMEVLQLVESPRTTTSPERSTSKTRRMLDIRRFLPKRRSGHGRS